MSSYFSFTSAGKYDHRHTLSARDAPFIHILSITLSLMKGLVNGTFTSQLWEVRLDFHLIVVGCLSSDFKSFGSQ